MFFFKHQKYVRAGNKRETIITLNAEYVSVIEHTNTNALRVTTIHRQTQ